MPIKVTCRCGQQFAAKDELAGKVVKCPKCQQSLKVGASPAPQSGGPVRAQAAGPSAVAKLLDEVGFHLHEKEDDSVQHCPACDQEISDHAVLCVYCGYSLETGKFVKGMGGGPGAIQKAEGHEGAALMLLKKAERAITQDKDEERKMRTQGMPLWMIITILSIIASFTVGMSVLPRDQAFRVSGFVWIIVCGTLAIVYWFRLVVIAFKESISHGLMFQFVPFYALVYVVKRWDDCGKLFMTHMILSLLLIPGYMLVLVAPKLKSEPAREVTLAGSHPPAVLSAPLAPALTNP